MHVLIYDSGSFTANFDDVNNDGTPCGPTGATCKSPITVPKGQTLWLTWHVAYQWLGSPLFNDIPSFASCGTGSPHGTISITGTLANQSLTLSCGPVTANGRRTQ